MCAVSVSLTDKQLPFFLMPESVPHLSLSKAKEQTWAEMGGFVKKCVDATDWCEISAGVKHSESLGAFMSDCKHEIEVEREVVTIGLSKLQFVKQQVTFLGHVITPNSKSLSEKRVQGIKDVPKPITKKQMLSFLGMCSYCRTFIPNYAILEQPLRALTIGKGLKSCDKIEWTGEAAEAFVTMKVQLSLAPALGLPVPNKPFVQMVDEKNGFMTSVLLQNHGDRLLEGGGCC